MQTMVIYDIENDRIRARIAEVCKDYGLGRIQKSAFLGDLDHNRREEMAQRLRKTLSRWKGDIQLCPVCDKDLGMRMLIAVTAEEAEKAQKEREAASGKRSRKRGQKTGAESQPESATGPASEPAPVAEVSKE